MSIQVSTNSALERYFIAQAQTNPADFPSRNKDYLASYKTIKEHLANNYYQVTGAALAQGDQRFTKHDITHVDDVIDTAGRIIGLKKMGEQPPEITPYETFVLLTAILIHDAGNAYARSGHEIQAARILRDLGEASPFNDVERHLVASIASAHGGKNPDGTRDTIEKRVIQSIAEVDGCVVHARRIAALVRLADEFSERTRRADVIAIKTMTPPKAYLPNFFCHAVNVTIDSTSRSASMDFYLEKSSLESLHPDPENGGKQTLIVDYIARRLEKADLERRYCNRYLAGWRPLDVFRSTITVHEEDVPFGGTTSATLSDTGYPTASRKPAFIGEELQRTYCGGSAND